MKWFLLLALAGLLAGCTYTRASFADGSTLTTVGGLLVNREGEQKVVDEWLGQDNVLHTRTMNISGKETTDNQIQAMQLMYQLGAQAAARGAAGAVP